MDTSKYFGHTVKTEPDELTSQPATKKVRKESADLDSLTRQKPNVLIKEEDAKFKVNNESTNLDSFRRHVKEENIEQEHKWQDPNGLKKEEDTRCERKQYIKLERNQNPISRRSLVKTRSSYLEAGTLLPLHTLYMPFRIRRQWDHPLDMPFLIHSRWECLTETEFLGREIWWNLKPNLNMLSQGTIDDLKAGIPKQLEARRAFYNHIRKRVERRLKGKDKEDVLYAFAVYFLETQKDVQEFFPDMTRQEVYDTCLLRYFAMERKKQTKYEEERESENNSINKHRFNRFGEEWSTVNPRVNHFTKEQIEAYIKRMPKTIEIELGEKEGRQFLNVLDIKLVQPPAEKQEWSPPSPMLVNHINCRWKNLTAEKNFQYEVTRALGGAISIEDINEAWRNLGDDMKMKNLEQTRLKVEFLADIKLFIDTRQKEVRYSFSSYFCEFENVIKTEFPEMTASEVYDTCLLRYIAGPYCEVRWMYELLSTREECKRLYRFGRTLWA